MFPRQMLFLDADSIRRPCGNNFKTTTKMLVPASASALLSTALVPLPSSTVAQWSLHHCQPHPSIEMNTGVQGLLHIAKSLPIALLKKLLLATEAFFLKWQNPLLKMIFQNKPPQEIYFQRWLVFLDVCKNACIFRVGSRSSRLQNLQLPFEII